MDHDLAEIEAYREREHYSLTCPECEKAEMVEDDHVWVCPECEYETSEPDEDDEVVETYPGQSEAMRAAAAGAWEEA